MTTGTTVSGPTATGGKTMPEMALLGLRAVQFVFAIIVLGTIGAVIASDDKVNGLYDYSDGVYDTYYYLYTPGSFKYNMFVGAWTILVVAYNVAAFFVPSARHIMIHLVLDGLSVIFWFAAWVAVAAWLGAYSRYYGYGTEMGRSLLIAGTVFGAFTDLAFLATLLLGGLAHRTSRRAASSQPTSYPMQQPMGQPMQQPTTMHQGPVEQKPMEHPAV